MPDGPIRITTPVVLLTEQPGEQKNNITDNQLAHWGSHLTSFAEWRKEVSCQLPEGCVFISHPQTPLNSREISLVQEPTRHLQSFSTKDSELIIQQPSTSHKKWKARTISFINWQRSTPKEISKDLLFSSQSKALSARRARPTFTAETFSSQQPLKPHQFNKIELLGSGNFGNVYKVQDESGHTFAQKRIRKDDPAIRAEVETMEALKQTGPHKNLINLECTYRDESGDHMVMELGGKSLDSRLKSGKRFTGNALRRLMHQIANGASAMAKSGYQHNDIKPDNILIDENKQLKLCDFGVATLKGRWPLKFPRQYMPPEVMSGSSGDLSKIDSWSIGCVFAEMITGHPLFPSSLWERPKHDRHLKMLECIDHASKQINLQEGASALRLFNSLMELKPEYRISPEHILNKSYFNQH
ncbi:serine/threonine-protein kinase [Endozoicomonas elysicola]|uniref:Protein kinase domain-containing protein n=1 Tax=Endozoicomonas elysicola TaxID=305900 RepID=A0A081KDS9_9GAMM|nr:serine/threonine-protein kinase [Endozoicomonas elysicola]KEI72305.1 hypothetical protein GV64_17630 [Endozoicomonas elysicola]